MPARTYYPAPYVMEKPGETVSNRRARVQQYGDDNLVYWLDRLSMGRPAVPLDILDRQSPRQSLDRIIAMLEALKGYLAKCEPERLAELHVPTRFASVGAKTVYTSPALVSVLSILFSHVAWTEPQFHDIFSALRAEKLLDEQRFPEALIDRIALLISLKNVVRTAIGPNKEVGVWTRGRMVVDNDSIAACLAAVLFSSGAMEEWFCDALLLVAGAYEGRSGNAVAWDQFEDLGEHLKRLGPQQAPRNPAEDSEADSTPGTLIALEFGKYFFEDPNERQECLANIAGSGSFPRDFPPPLFLVSLGRYWGVRHRLEPHHRSQVHDHLVPYEPSDSPRCLKDLIPSATLALHRLRLDGDVWFRFIFGFQPEPSPKTTGSVSLLVGQVSEKFVQHRQNGRIPAAFIGRMLEVLYHCYPELMSKLEIRGNIFHDMLPFSSSLYLPKSPPETTDLERSVEQDDWLDPSLLVARYAAAVVMNRGIGYGDLARTITCEDPQVPVKDWIKVINWVAKKNAHVALANYVKKFRAAPPDTLYAPPERRSINEVQDPLVLGVDIGGNYTKVGLYRLTRAADDWKLNLAATHEGFGTRSPDDKQYPNAAGFVERLRKELGALWGAEFAPDRLVAVGVTWPGAVAGPPGLEFVASNSGALTFFRPFPTVQHWTASDDDIRLFGLREAFEQAFSGVSGGKCPVVRLINDGVALVLSERAQLAVFAGGPGALVPGEIVAGLFAGTGSALALLLQDGALMSDVLAELGRLITHVSDPFPPAGAVSYPAGTGRDAFNRLTLGRVATQVLLEAQGATPAVAATISQHLQVVLDNLAGASLALRAASVSLPASNSVRLLSPAQNFLADAAARLPLVPSLLIGYLLESDPIRRAKLEDHWRAERPKTITADLVDLERFLDDTLVAIALPAWPNASAFAAEVARRAGQELADLVASASATFRATNVIVGGGPLSGDTGRCLRAYARAELHDTYRFDVLSVAPPPGTIRPRLSRTLRFPDPQTTLDPAGPSGAYGAALAAVDLLPVP